MNPKRLVWLVAERWLLVTLLILLGAGAGIAHFFTSPVEYTSRISMYVAAQVTDNPELAYQGAQLSEQRVKSYTLLATSPGVIDGARQQLALQESSSSLAARLIASNATDTVIVDIDATASDPKAAADLANAVGTSFSLLVARLEAPTSATGIPAVSVRAVQPASFPPQPSSMSLPTNIALGVIAGLLLGVATALVRGLLDTRVKSPERLQEITSSPVLGTTAYDDKHREKPANNFNDTSAQSESYRHIRTNITFVDVDTPPKVLLITSSLPGEGKSTIASNIAVALVASGYRALLIEADLRRPRLAEAFGLEGNVGLTSVLTGQIELNQAIQHWSPAKLPFLASGPIPPNPSELLGSRKMANLVVGARHDYDFVVIDSPPLLPVADAAVLSGAADGVVLVCQYNQTSSEQVGQAAEALQAVGARVLGTILSMVPATGLRAYARYTTYYSSRTSTSGSPARDISAQPHAPKPDPARMVSRLDAETVQTRVTRDSADARWREAEQPGWLPRP